MIFTKFIEMGVENAQKKPDISRSCWELLSPFACSLSTNMICTNVLVIITGLVLQVAQPGTQMQWCATITGVVTASLAESKLLRFFKVI